MSKLKIIAKSHLISKTAPILFTFLLCISVLFLFGNLSVFMSYIMNFNIISNAVSFSIRNIMSAFSAVIGILLIILLLAPLRLGRERWFMMNARGENPKTNELFHYFNRKRYLRSLAAWCYACALKLGSFTVFFFPFFCLSGVIYYCVIEHGTAFSIFLFLLVADVLIFLIAAGFMFVYSGEFLMYYPIIVSNNNVSPSQAYAYSVKMTSPVLLKLARFRLSFAPWWLLSVFVLPTFYSWGYYNQTLSELAYRNEYLN